MKKIYIIVILSLIFLTTGCSSDDYTSCNLEEKLDGNLYELKFDSLDGKIVRKLTDDNKSDGTISCSGFIEEGSIDIYYKVHTNKEYLLLTINSGEEFSMLNGYYSNNALVTIYIYANNAVKGNIKIELVNSVTK